MGQLVGLSILIVVAIFIGWLFFASRRALKNRGKIFDRLEEIAEVNAIPNLLANNSEYYLVFTTPTCPACQQLKKSLLKKGIEFIEIPALQYGDICRELGISGVPTSFQMKGKRIENVLVGKWI